MASNNHAQIKTSKFQESFDICNAKPYKEISDASTFRRQPARPVYQDRSMTEYNHSESRPIQHERRLTDFSDFVPASQVKTMADLDEAEKMKAENRRRRRAKTKAVGLARKLFGKALGEMKGASTV